MRLVVTMDVIGIGVFIFFHLLLNKSILIRMVQYFGSIKWRLNLNYIYVFCSYDGILVNSLEAKGIFSWYDISFSYIKNYDTS